MANLVAIKKQLYGEIIIENGLINKIKNILEKNM